MGGWGGSFPNRPKKNKSPRKSPFLTRISPFVFPNLTKTLGWVGGFKGLGKFFQKKAFLGKISCPENQILGLDLHSIS